MQKTCLYLSKQPASTVLSQSEMFLGTEELECVKDFKLGVIIDSSLSFKKHVKMISKMFLLNLYNFKQIRGSLSDAAALMFLHAITFSDLSYCITINNYLCRALLSLNQQSFCTKSHLRL